MSVELGRKQERLTAEHFTGLFSSSSLGRGCARGPKKYKIDCFVFRASSRIPIPRLLSLSISGLQYQFSSAKP